MKIELTKEELEILHLALLSQITVLRDVKNNIPSLRVVSSINEEIDLAVSLNSKICEAMK